MGIVRPLVSSLLSFALLCSGAARAAEAVAAPPKEASPGGSVEKKSGKAAGARGGRAGGGQKQTVEVTHLHRRDLSETLSVVGSLAPNETATIRPEMVGLIRAIHFEEGQRVKKGALLVKIDDAELRAQLAQSESRFDLAKQNLGRADTLRQTQSNTQADADRARSEFTAAQAEIDLLKVRLARTEVRAPFDGTVGARTLSAGDFVNTQAVITTINDLSKLKVEFQVPERYLGKMRVGTPFTVKSAAADGAPAAKGEVYFVNSVISRETRSSDAKGYLNEPSTVLRAGMFAVIEVVLDVRKGALTAPEGAILVDQRGPQLVVMRDRNGDKIAEFVPVVLGLRSRGIVEVRAQRVELNETTQIVAAGVGSLALFQGALLEPVPLRAEFRTND